MSFINDTFSDEYLEYLDEENASVVYRHGFIFKDELYLIDYIWVFRQDRRRRMPAIIAISTMDREGNAIELIPYPDDVAEAAIAEIEVETEELCLN